MYAVVSSPGSQIGDRRSQPIQDRRGSLRQQGPDLRLPADGCRGGQQLDRQDVHGEVDGLLGQAGGERRVGGVVLDAQVQAWNVERRRADEGPQLGQAGGAGVACQRRSEPKHLADGLGRERVEV